MEINKKVVLKNGLRALFLPESQNKTSAFGISLNAGPYFEDQKDSGISHLLEHLVGGQTVGSKTLRDQIYKNGGLVDASTSVIQTFFHLYSQPADFINNIKILTDGIFTPNLTEETLDLSKESVLSEMAFAQDFSPYTILRNLMWKDPRLTKSIVGTKDSILSVDLERVRKYHRYYYSANNSAVVVIAKDFPAELTEVLEKIPSNKNLILPDVGLDLKKPDFKIFQERNLHSTIAFAFPTIGYKGLSEDRHLFNIAANSLNDYFIAELGKTGLVYEASWNWNIFPQNGDFVIYLESLDNHHVVQALKLGLELVASWSKLSLTKESFEIVKKHIILNLLLEASMIDKLTLFTKNFASSENAHTYEEALGVYNNATIENTLKTVENVLLSKKPYSVVSLGADSMENLGKINQVLQDFYHT